MNMAVMYEGVCCAICATPIDTGVSGFATSGVFVPVGHHLFRFCDAPMHWDCYAHWSDRAEFARAYFHMWVDAERNSPYWSKAFLSPEAFVTVNPDPDVAQISVRLVETGTEVRVPLEQWEEWLSVKAMTAGEKPVEQRALDAVVRSLREELPTFQAVLQAVDGKAKAEIREHRRRRTRAEEEDRLRKPSAHNKACRILLRQGLACPACGADDPKYIDRSPESKSEFVCHACETVFGPVEVIVKHLYG
jgi:hypothetical protein